MEQFLNDNMYVIDLGELNTAPEIIFELSSVLDKEEVKNKRICLKLGNVDLNQAQLLSIKSLINGIDSTLSCVDTKSVETEKVALSLGIIVSNVSAENAVELAPTMPYKMAEELKDEAINTETEENEDIVEESDINSESLNDAIIEDNESLPSEQTEESREVEENIEPQQEESQIEKEVVAEPTETINSDIDNGVVQETEKEEIQDELDVIFGSTPSQTVFYDMQHPTEMYEEREELTDIIVPEQEYTKEDIELESFPTKYIKQTIRSGQVINYEGNIVIIGDCHPGCEVTAFGDITVWGILSGIAHAGAGGNQKAKVRALKMNAIQLRIANCYSRRPDSLNTVYIEKTNSFTPEEARIVNGEIVVFKMND